MSVTRWPLHPHPLAGEALSSWLRRIAAAYEFHVDDLLVHDLGFRSLSDHELDLEPPDSLLALLSGKTGVDVARIRLMTIKGLLPEAISRGMRGTAYFARYVKRYSVLLSPDRRERRQLNSWRPWITERRFASSVGCPRCLATDAIRYRRLVWRLSLTACCPKHGVLNKVWQAAELRMRVTAPVSQPFEELSFVRQVQFLHAAAEAIELMSSQRLETRGRDGHLLGGVKMPNKQDLQQFSSAVSDDLAHPAPIGQRLREATEALLKSARASRRGARTFRKFLLLGKSNPERIANVDRFLVDVGIVTR